MKNFLAVGCGGFVGAMARYGVGLLVARVWRSPIPLSTFLINVTGSFILGLFATWAAERAALAPLWRLLIGTGFVGAYTTFSTFEFETQGLVEAGLGSWAALNVGASVLAGFVAVRLGVYLGR
jgi:CrcB protein